jgi:hypothetical protein
MPSFDEDELELLLGVELDEGTATELELLPLT